MKPQKKPTATETEALELQIDNFLFISEYRAYNKSANPSNWESDWEKEKILPLMLDF